MKPLLLPQEIKKLFALIEQAKQLANYPLANIAWGMLLEKALDFSETLIQFEVETDNEEEGSEDYYGLAVIKIGSSLSACIPLPLLNKGARKAFYSMAKKVGHVDHDRLVDIDTSPEDVPILLAHLKDELSKYGDIQKILNKYFLDQECSLCPYFATGHNKGAIHCSVNPCGYPQGLCKDFEMKINEEESVQKIKYALCQWKLIEYCKLRAFVDRRNKNRKHGEWLLDQQKKREKAIALYEKKEMLSLEEWQCLEAYGPWRSVGKRKDWEINQLGIESFQEIIAEVDFAKEKGFWYYHDCLNHLQKILKKFSLKLHKITNVGVYYQVHHWYEKGMFPVNDWIIFFVPFDNPKEFRVIQPLDYFSIIQFEMQYSK